MSDDTIKTPLNPEEFPPGGIPGMLYIVPVFAEGNHSDEERLRDSSERDFDLRCSFATHLSHTRNIEARIKDGEGTSFFLVSHHVEPVKVQTPHGEFLLEKNSDGEMCGGTAQCKARSSRDAIRYFLSMVSPFLDTLAYRADMPLVIEKVQCIDKKNSVTVVNYVAPYLRVNLNSHAGQIFEPMIPMYAMYREAKNNTSVYYRLLCFYKILEGIYNYLRPNLMRAAHRQRINLQTRRELVPNHPELQRFHASYINSPIHPLFEGEFKQLRDVAAHFLLDDGRIANVADAENQSKFSDFLLVAQLCVRVAIDTQEDYYKQYFKGGGNPEELKATS